MDSEAGDLTPLLKAKISWIVARQDRAWYATALAYNALKRHGLNDDQIFQLDGDWAGLPSDERALCHFARQLAMAPIALSDEDFDAALKATSPGVVVQLVNYVAGLAYFDRVTEAAGLPATVE
jgi:alkylhydroperoxidase family enzyme